MPYGQHRERPCNDVLEQYKLYVEMADRTTQRLIVATSSDVVLVTNILVAALTAGGGKASSIGFTTFPTVILGFSGVLLCWHGSSVCDSTPG